MSKKGNSAQRSRAKAGFKKSKIYDAFYWEIPRQVPLGPKTVGWLESELDTWIDERVREREETPGNGRARR